MNCAVLKNNILGIDEYNIVPLRREDIFLIKNWRNQQINVLRQNKILTDEGQVNYYEQVVIPSFSQSQPKIILFSYLFKNECIGYGGLTNIDWHSKRAEMSFLLDTKRAKDKKLYEIEFSNFITFMKKVAFDNLQLNRVFTETYDLREWHIRVLEKNGFKLEGIMREHVFIEGKFVDSLIHGYLRKEYEMER
jgi:RimJ/RimL family protein N-acetyltransferase